MEKEIEGALNIHASRLKEYEVMQKGYGNQAVRQLYDEVEQDVGELLKEFSFAFRRPKSDSVCMHAVFSTYCT